MLKKIADELNVRKRKQMVDKSIKGLPTNKAEPDNVEVRGKQYFQKYLSPFWGVVGIFKCFT